MVRFEKFWTYVWVFITRRNFYSVFKNGGERRVLAYPSLTLLLIVRDVSVWLDLSCVAVVIWWLGCAGCAAGRRVASGTRTGCIITSVFVAWLALTRCL